MGLWTPPTGVGLLRRSTDVRVVTLPDGRRAQVTTEGTTADGMVRHIETDEAIDAVAMPRTTVYRFRRD